MSEGLPFIVLIAWVVLFGLSIGYGLQMHTSYTATDCVVTDFKCHKYNTNPDSRYRPHDYICSLTCNYQINGTQYTYMDDVTKYGDMSGSYINWTMLIYYANSNPNITNIKNPQTTAKGVFMGSIITFSIITAIILYMIYPTIRWSKSHDINHIDIIHI